MSNRGTPARTRPLTHRLGGASRRARAGAAAGAVVAVLVLAGVIGSGGVDDAGPTSAGGGAVARDVAVETAGMDGSGASGGDAASPTTAASGIESAPRPEGGASIAADEDVSSTAGQGGSAEAPTTGTGNRLDPKIVRTGSLDLVVARGSFDRAASRLTSLATGAGGFVSASQTSALDDAPQGTITLRVPVDRFDEVVAQVRKLGTVASLSTGSQDVTGEYSDVAARIKALRDEREQITLVLGRAETIPDILSVRDRLAVVQSELEQLQGRQQVLDDQTSLSTLAVSVREKGQPTADTAPPVERTGLDKLWHDVGDRFTDGLRAIALGLATLAPWLLLALVLFLPARAMWRRLASPAPGDEPVGSGTTGPAAPSPA